MHTLTLWAQEVLKPLLEIVESAVLTRRTNTTINWELIKKQPDQGHSKNDGEVVSGVQQQEPTWHLNKIRLD